MRNVMLAGLLALAIGACGEPETMPETEAEAARAALEEALPAPEETVALTFRVEDAKGALEELAAAIDHRLLTLGLGTAEAVPGEPPRVVCRVRDGDEAHRFRVAGLISSRGTLAFRVVVPERETEMERDKRENLQEFYEPAQPGWEWLPPRDGESDVLVEIPEPRSDDDFTQRDLASAEPMGGGDGRGWMVQFEIVESRRDAFKAFTERNLKRQLAIVLDGVVEVAPVIRSPLPGQGVIEGGGGGFSEERAHALALILGSGRSYDARLVLESVEEPGTK